MVEASVKKVGKKYDELSRKDLKIVKNNGEKRGKW